MTSRCLKADRRGSSFSICRRSSSILLSAAASSRFSSILQWPYTNEPRSHTGNGAIIILKGLHNPCYSFLILAQNIIPWQSQAPAPGRGPGARPVTPPRREGGPGGIGPSPAQQELLGQQVEVRAGDQHGGAPADDFEPARVHELAHLAPVAGELEQREHRERELHAQHHL